ncbi:MAG: FAD-dependent thymidylate synthase [Acidimicrobiales bacterium]
MHLYVPEAFDPHEQDLLRRYFTNLDQPVFALVNLPEVVKGALFARYSRSAKSLRRLFLDEFVGDLDVSGDVTVDATAGLRRAEELYQRVFFEYGDDSVAQLGGVHLACEQASNLLTKALEWGRLMAYLEQSTRYVPYDQRPNGRYRYYRDPAIMASPLAARYVADLDALFATYAELLPVLSGWFAERHPREPGDSELVWRRSVRARALDALRGLLPAAAQSNVGIYGTGQGYELMLLRLRAHPLPEARWCAETMLTELRKVIPSFLTRVDRPDRGGAWSAYLEANHTAVGQLAGALLGAEAPAPRPAVTLVDFDPDGEDKVVAAMLYPHTHLPEDEVLARVRAMSAADKQAVAVAYAGQRANRRHKPGRALERTAYRFDVLCDYGAFRDLQRHRMLTVEWQDLTPRHGYQVPAAVDGAGLTEPFVAAMARSAALWEALAAVVGPLRAAYAVTLAHRIRFVLQMNAREAMHLIELRSGAQGHPDYRSVAQEMHRLIADQAGHRAIAAMMSFVDRSTPALGRLAAERRAQPRPDGAGGVDVAPGG